MGKPHSQYTHHTVAARSLRQHVVGEVAAPEVIPIQGVLGRRLAVVAVPSEPTPFEGVCDAVDIIFHFEQHFLFFGSHFDALRILSMRQGSQHHKSQARRSESQPEWALGAARGGGSRDQVCVELSLAVLATVIEPHRRRAVLEQTRH